MIQKIAKQARQSISSFCYEECKAFCCRKCYLILKESEVDLVTQGRKKELIDKGMIKQMDDGRYSMYMGETGQPCPSLKDNKCKIHKSKNRPKTCSDFPIFIQGNKVMLSPRCLAVRQRKLYPYVAKMKQLGAQIMTAEEFTEYEFYKMDFEKDGRKNNILVPLHKKHDSKTSQR